MMRRRWIRIDAGPRETLGAGIVAAGLAVGVGLVSFYLTRLFLAREPLGGGRPAKLLPGRGTRAEDRDG